MKYRSYLCSALLISALSSYGQTDREQKNNRAIFPKGTIAPESNFTGKVWSNPIMPNDTTYNLIIGNVTFEPGARSNWHSHNSGQILLVTDGIGYYQERGKPIEVMKKGDVIKCRPGIEHWHGASPTRGCTHIAIVPNTEKGIVKWLQPVTDKEYHARKQ